MKKSILATMIVASGILSAQSVVIGSGEKQTTAKCAVVRETKVSDLLCGEEFTAIQVVSGEKFYTVGFSRVEEYDNDCNLSLNQKSFSIGNEGGKNTVHILLEVDTKNKNIVYVEILNEKGETEFSFISRKSSRVFLQDFIDVHVERSSH